jgi:hypothetical protein
MIHVSFPPDSGRIPDSRGFQIPEDSGTNKSCPGMIYFPEQINLALE